MTIKRSAVGWQGLGVLHSIVEAGELTQEDPVEKREGQLHRTVGGKDDGDFVLHKRLNATATGSDSGVYPEGPSGPKVSRRWVCDGGSLPMLRSESMD